ncbi:MAG: 1-acyl-sn-glycerol-3-phosphate acyltransferase [Pseudomonadota bacterium]|nr:1-acyl-sn-glycerol-3-phosphate acyltransferase [Pseudomonadota bacterium]
MAAFSLMFVVATLLALVVPWLDWRRRITHRLATLALPVLGLRVTVTGLEKLPPTNCVVVANHASYLDGIIMKAVLPPRFSFVIKREAASLPLAGFLLKRIGSEFVDRHSEGGRRRDALRVLRVAESGRALVFFPEGTFDALPGLKRFHVGAFAAAVRGEMPVVPVVILGARRAMPGGAMLVRPGRIRVEILAPIAVPASVHAADEMRAEARRRMVARLDEPDLAAAVASAGGRADACASSDSPGGASTRRDAASTSLVS